MKKSTAIYNKKSDVIEIDLIGTFEDFDWWGETNITKQTIIDLLNNNPTAQIIANLSSLGGSVDTALAAHDWIQKHKGHTKVRLLGRNASASTFFSSAFDTVEISESGMFLVHNVWGMAVGEAEELRKIADDFDKHNEVIVNIYKKRTGKSTQEIKDLMAENKWITAEEALSFGFVSSIFKPKESDGKFNIQKQSIYNKYLPKIRDAMTDKKTNIIEDDGLHIKDEKSFFEKIGNFLKPEIKDISEETKAEYEAQLNASKAAGVQLSVKVTALEAGKVVNETLISELKAEIEVSKLEKEDLTTKLAAKVAESTKQVNDDDKLDIGELSEYEKAWQSEAKSMKENF